MTPERWQAIREVLHEALELAPPERSAYLERACASDTALRREVESLLASSEAARSSFLESAPLAHLTPPEVLESEDSLAGRRVGVYQLVRRIGRGGMAAVFLATRADGEFNQQVAIKVVLPGLNSDEVLKRFRNERQTLAGLDHPNIVKLLDGGSTPEGAPYLVMDYVEGSPIDEYCDSHKLSVQERLQLFGKVCQAVEYAHQKLVIHRDLKPSNIQVTAEGVPKLLDFGIAKVLEPAAPAPSLNQTGTRCMTPAYASPEQVRGRSVTLATDIYSLGVVLYELMTGHRPYRLKEHTPAEIERAICEQEPETPSTAVSRVERETSSDGTTVTETPELVSRTREGQPEKLRRRLRGDVDNIALKALQKEEERRYLSVGELSEDIQRHLRHLPVKARPNTLGYRSARFLRRHRTQATAVGALVLVLLAGVALSTWETRRAVETARAELSGDRMPGRPSVAVLGFRNLSSRPETSWVSTALSELLTAELAAGGKLRTVSGEDVVSMKIDLSLPETNQLARQTLSRVRRYLKSDYVVFGSYLDLGGAASQQIRLDVRLQDAAVGNILASVTLSGTAADLSDVAARAGASLREKLGAGAAPPTETAQIKASQPSNTVALRLYSEGLEKLRGFDVGNGRSLLERAVVSDPNSALIHSALAEAWGTQGYEGKAKEEAKKALALAAGLPREQGLSIEGEALQVTHEWAKAAEIYRALFTFFPDNLDYGVRLVTALSSAGKGQDAMATVDELRKLPKPLADDPRVDLAEATAAGSLGDLKREEAAAVHAREKAKAQGARGLQAQARFTESEALNRLGEPERALAAAEQARQLWAAAGDRNGVAQALNNIGYADDDVGKYEDAKKAYTESLRTFHELGNRWDEARLLNNLGIILWRQGERAGARRDYQESLAISRELGNLRMVSTTLTDLAVLELGDGETAEGATRTGFFASAKAHFDESLTIDRNRHDEAGVAATLNSLSLLLMDQEDFPAAKAAIEESIRINRKVGQKNQLAYAFGNLSQVLFDQGELAPAKKYSSEAVQLFTSIGNQENVRMALRDLAGSYLASGDLAGARRFSEEALAGSEKAGDKRGAGASRVMLASLCLEEGNVIGAEPLARQAAAEFQEIKDTESESSADTALARMLRQQKKLKEAESIIARARELVSKSKDHFTRISVAIEDAQVRAALGRGAEAARLLSDSLVEAKRAGLVPLELEVRLALGEVEIEGGKFGAGRAELKTLEQEAKAKGFLLVGRKAAAARK
jgi:eukaryotic-like serine/threonine-protein kinase